jgi:Ser/Thr protein kinase RdoA (MazF antagonist)
MQRVHPADLPKPREVRVRRADPYAVLDRKRRQTSIGRHAALSVPTQDRSAACACDDPGMDGDPLPDQVLRDASLAILPGQIPTRQGRAIVVEWHGRQAVLRSVSPAVPEARGMRLVADVRWLHTFLSRLVALGFPAPQPLLAFAGNSWTIADGVLWELLSFLPGSAVGWSRQPPMEEIGALLARYHAAAGQIRMAGQRPSALPLVRVPGVLLSSLDSPDISARQSALIRHHAERLARRLREVAPRDRERTVIHGDFTNDNVIASGIPPAATGVVDFALAHVERPLADIGYALWRSGRPAEHASCLDLGRVSRYLHGYHSVRPVSADQAAIIPAYLIGRGLQMIAKRLRGRRPDIGMLPEVQWISMNEQALTDAIQGAVGR